MSLKPTMGATILPTLEQLEARNARAKELGKDLQSVVNEFFPRFELGFTTRLEELPHTTPVYGTPIVYFNIATDGEIPQIATLPPPGKSGVMILEEQFIQHLQERYPNKLVRKVSTGNPSELAVVITEKNVLP